MGAKALRRPVVGGRLGRITASVVVSVNLPFSAGFVAKTLPLRVKTDPELPQAEPRQIWPECLPPRRGPETQYCSSLSCAHDEDVLRVHRGEILQLTFRQFDKRHLAGQYSRWPPTKCSPSAVRFLWVRGRRHLRRKSVPAYPACRARTVR